MVRLLEPSPHCSVVETHPRTRLLVCRDTPPPDTPLRDGRLDRIYYYCSEWDEARLCFSKKYIRIIKDSCEKRKVNALPKVVGFPRVLRFPHTGKVDRVG